MDTGKVEYTADPKVKTLHGHVSVMDEAAIIAAGVDAERTRLEQAVVEAAKQWSKARLAQGIWDACNQLTKTVDALESFEAAAEQKG